jgi:catechol 2,3-dioxygenase-like lactoylglutathione lyase family enzyme
VRASSPETPAGCTRSPGETIQDLTPEGIERVDFVSVPTRDAERARAFYHDVLGLPLDERNSAEIATGNLTLVFWNPEAEGIDFQANQAGIALRVPDVAEARARLEGVGVEFLGETVDTGVCHMSFFRDPDGNVLILHRRYAPYQENSG